MKELRDGETTHASALGADKLMHHDADLQHLVTSSIPSPTYGGLSLINATMLDPIYSAHLLIAASNSGTRFQLPILPIATTAAIPTTTARLFDFNPAAIPVSGLTAPNAQLSLLSTWVNEQANANANNNKMQQQLHNHFMGRQRNASGNGQMTDLNLDINSNNNNHQNNNNNPNRKRGTNFSVNKANKKNKEGRAGLLITAENGVAIKKNEDDGDHQSDMDIIPTIIPIDKTSKVSSVGHKKLDESGSGGEESCGQPANNNNKGTNTSQQSNQQSRDKVFTCPICNRCFGYKHVLQNHERTHTGEKPYFCKICDKRFTRDHHLKTHMRLHTGEKPYNCTHCDKQFVQVANLRRHLRVHTGERPYSCEMCDSRFSDSNQLKAHMLIHKGQKPYYCEICTTRFRRRHHLTQHKCMKNGEDPNQTFPNSSPDHDDGISPPASENKKHRQRKSRETRKIIRVPGLPLPPSSTGSGIELGSLISSLPEQEHPEDLSLSSSSNGGMLGLGGGRSRNNSGSGGSHSSVSASPSPSGSHLLIW